MEWYNSNEYRNYPFKEDVSLIAADDARLPNNIIADLHLEVPAEYYGPVFCNQVKITPNIISVSFSTESNGLFVGTYDRSKIASHTAQPLISLLGNTNGWIVFGGYKPEGTEIYRFSGLEDSEVDFRVVTIGESLSILNIVKSGYDSQQNIAKLVKLVGGDNIKIYKHATANAIVIELQNPEEFVGPCNSDLDTLEENTMLHSINGVKGTSDGVFTLRFDR